MCRVFFVVPGCAPQGRRSGRSDSTVTPHKRTKMAARSKKVELKAVNSIETRKSVTIELFDAATPRPKNWVGLSEEEKAIFCSIYSNHNCSSICEAQWSSYGQASPLMAAEMAAELKFCLKERVVAVNSE